LRWIAEGVAISPRPLTELLPAGAGVWVDSASARQPYMAQLSEAGLECQDWNGSAQPPYPRTLFLRGDVPVRLTLLPVGYQLLDRWEMVVPLYSYDTLASQIGSETDRERTKAVIRDLRVPVYDPRLMFLRRCRNVEALMGQWVQELREGGDEKLAFMRAMYRVKPQLCAVPASWTDPHAPG